MRVVLGERGLELPRDRARQLAEVDLLLSQLQRPGLELGEVEQVNGELSQALDLVSNLIEEAAPGIRVELFVLQELDKPAQREDRRPQLMGCGGDELLPRGLELRELSLHVVERDRELTELVSRVHRNRAVEVPGRNLFGRQLEPLHAPCQPPGDHITPDQREQQRDSPGDQDLVTYRRDVLDHV